MNMTDIVGRLRAKRVRGRPGFYNPDELCQEAATEIERLRSNIGDECIDPRGYTGPNAMLAEIAMLRALLSEARLFFSNSPYVDQSIKNMRDKIDAALTGGERATPRDGDICASCGAPYQEHQPGGTRYGPTTLCGVFIPGGNEPN